MSNGFIINFNGKSGKKYTVNHGTVSKLTDGELKESAKDLTDEEYRAAKNYASEKTKQKAHKDSVAAAGASRHVRAKIRAAEVEADEVEESEVDLVELMEGGTLQWHFDDME